MTVVSGVRISWLTVARKASFSRTSAWSDRSWATWAVMLRITATERESSGIGMARASKCRVPAADPSSHVLTATAGPDSGSGEAAGTGSGIPRNTSSRSGGC